MHRGRGAGQKSQANAFEKFLLPKTVANADDFGSDNIILLIKLLFIIVMGWWIALAQVYAGVSNLDIYTIHCSDEDIECMKEKFFPCCPFQVMSVQIACMIRASTFFFLRETEKCVRERGGSRNMLCFLKTSCGILRTLISKFWWYNNSTRWITHEHRSITYDADCISVLPSAAH